VKRLTATIVTAVALVLGATVYAAFARGGSTRSVGSGTRPGLVVTGSVSGLHPGGCQRLALHVHNLLNHRVVVRWLTVQVGQPGGGSPARAVTGGRYPVTLSIAKRATRTIAVSLRMVAGAPNACQNARFPLTFKVTSDGSR
jgi:hypothetical protein